MLAALKGEKGGAARVFPCARGGLKERGREQVVVRSGWRGRVHGVTLTGRRARTVREGEKTTRGDFSPRRGMRAEAVVWAKRRREGGLGQRRREWAAGLERKQAKQK